MLINHPTIAACLEQTDTEILDALVSLHVVDFYAEPRPYTDKKTKKTTQKPANGFRITLEFADGDATVKAGKITTEIAILAIPPKPKVKSENEDKEDDEDDQDEDAGDDILITQTPATAFRNPKYAEKNSESFFASWLDTGAKDKWNLKALGEVFRDIYRNPLPDDEEDEDDGQGFGEDDDEDGEGDAQAEEQ